MSVETILSVCIHTCTHLGTRAHTHTHACIYACVHTCMHACVCVHMHTYAHMRTGTSAHKHSGYTKECTHNLKQAAKRDFRQMKTAIQEAHQTKNHQRLQGQEHCSAACMKQLTLLWRWTWLDRCIQKQLLPMVCWRLEEPGWIHSLCHVDLEI